MNNLHQKILYLVLLFGMNSVNAQVHQNWYHSAGDSDHADSLNTNFSGIGFGSRFQLSLDTEFDFSESDTTSQTDLNSSIQILDGLTFGAGYTFNRTTDALPLRVALAISDTERWSLGVRTYRGDQTQETGVALMLRPANWLSIGAVLNRLVEGSMFEENDWQSPSSLFGITLRPFGLNHRVSGSVSLTDDWAIDSAGAQWFSRLFDRWEAGVSFNQMQESNEHALIFSLRTLGTLSLGASAGIRGRGDLKKNSMAISTRMRSEPRISKRLGPSATIATVDAGTGSEYLIEGWLSPEVRAPFLHTLQTLDALAQREDIDGVLLKLNGFRGGWAQSDELRRALLKVKASGKKTYVFLPYADLRLYTIASAADTIIATPTSGYELSGLTLSSLHIKGLLDQLGVEAEFVTTGAHKTAPETFTRSSPSSESKRSQSKIADAIFNHAKAVIALGRKVSEEKVDSWIDHGIHTGQMLTTHQLVDQQLHLDQAEAFLRRSFRGRTRIVSAHQVLRRNQGYWGKQSRVAVLYIVGNIIDGQSPTGLFSKGEATGSTTVQNAIQKLVSDPSVAGIVVRVDSPGGTITAADTIWRSLERANRKKPVVVSFGDVAASGGYYVAMSSKTIFAGDQTLTGSIGVFAGKFNFARLMHRWGLHSEITQRGSKAGIFSVVQPWSMAQRQAMQDSINEYDRIFRSRVHTARNMTDEQLAPLAGGRVFMGSEAQENKLIDRLGGLSDAIEYLKKSLGMRSGLGQLILSPSPEDTGRSFNVPTIPGVSTSHWSGIKSLFESFHGEFSRCLPTLYTLNQAHIFALMPEFLVKE